MKLVKKIMASVCAVAMTVSAFASLTAFASMNTSASPLDIYVEEVSHTAKGVYTYAIKYDNYATNMGIAQLSVYITISDKAAVKSVAGWTKVGAGSDATNNYSASEGIVKSSNSAVTGNCIADYTATSGTYYTFKVAYNAGYIDATSGDITSPLTLAVTYVKATIGEQEYDEDFEEYNYDMSSETVVYLGENTAITSSRSVEYASTPVVVDPWVSATQVGGLYNADTYVEDQSSAVAYYVSLDTPDAAEESMVWKANFSGTTKYHSVNIGSVTGAAKYGVIIKGVETAEDVTEVKAAWGSKASAE